MRTVLRIAFGALCVWLAVSLVLSPIAMWQMGDAPITLTSTVTVACTALALGGFACLFIGILWLLGGLVAWAWDL